MHVYVWPAGNLQRVQVFHLSGATGEMVSDVSAQKTERPATF